jgi:hypothetical protein
MDDNGRTLPDMVADAVGFSYQLFINGIMMETNSDDLAGLGQTYNIAVARAIGGELFREADRMPTKGHREAMTVRPKVTGHDATGGESKGGETKQGGRDPSETATEFARKGYGRESQFAAYDLEDLVDHRSHNNRNWNPSDNGEIQPGSAGDFSNIERLVRRLTVVNCKAAGLDYGTTDCRSAKRIITVLLATDGNVGKAAKELDIDRKTIQRAMPMLQDLLGMAAAIDEPVEATTDDDDQTSHWGQSYQPVLTGLPSCHMIGSVNSTTGHGHDWSRPGACRRTGKLGRDW